MTQNSPPIALLQSSTMADWEREREREEQTVCVRVCVCEDYYPHAAPQSVNYHRPNGTKKQPKSQYEMGDRLVNDEQVKEKNHLEINYETYNAFLVDFCSDWTICTHARKTEVYPKATYIIRIVLCEAIRTNK